MSIRHAHSNAPQIAIAARTIRQPVLDPSKVTVAHWTPPTHRPIFGQLFKAPKDLRRIGDAIMVTSGESKEGKRKDFEAVFPSLVEDLKQNATQYGIPAEALKWYEEVGLSSSELQRPICLLFSYTVMFVLMLALDIVTKLQHPWR